MAALSQYRRFEKHMSRIEAAYIKALRAEYMRTRRVLVDELAALGIDGPALPSVIRGEVARLEARAVEIGRQIGADVEFATGDFIGGQLAEFEGMPGLEQLLFDTADERTGIFRVTLGNVPAWVPLLGIVLLAEIRMLKASRESGKAIMARLFATTPQNGRVSIWRRIGNSLSIESSRLVWEAANGVLDSVYRRVNELVDMALRKQAIAMIDTHTTETCRRVHGQIVPVRSSFKLTGTPRFADRMKSPPFHWNCRTASVMVPPGVGEENQQLLRAQVIALQE